MHLWKDPMRSSDVAFVFLFFWKRLQSCIHRPRQIEERDGLLPKVNVNELANFKGFKGRESSLAQIEPLRITTLANVHNPHFRVFAVIFKSELITAIKLRGATHGCHHVIIRGGWTTACRCRQCIARVPSQLSTAVEENTLLHRGSNDGRSKNKNRSKKRKLHCGDRCTISGEQRGLAERWVWSWGERYHLWEWLIVTDAGLIYMLYYRSLNINFYIKVEFEYPRNTKHLPWKLLYTPLRLANLTQICVDVPIFRFFLCLSALSSCIMICKMYYRCPLNNVWGRHRSLSSARRIGSTTTLCIYARLVRPT